MIHAFFNVYTHTAHRISYLDSFAPACMYVKILSLHENGYVVLYRLARRPYLQDGPTSLSNLFDHFALQPSYVSARPPDTACCTLISMATTFINNLSYIFCGPAFSAIGSNGFVCATCEHVLHKRRPSKTEILPCYELRHTKANEYEVSFMNVGHFLV